LGIDWKAVYATITMKKNKLTVGIFTHDFFPIFGGQGRHIYELYKQNQEHQKISMMIFSPSKNTLPNHTNLYPETKKSLLKNLAYSWKLHHSFEEIIKEKNLDLVHIHGGPGGLFLFKKLSVPTFYTTHHTYWQQQKYISSQRWKYIFYLLEKKSYSFADQVISVSTDTQNILERYYNQKKVTYIPNGISENKIVASPPNNGLKNILYVGRIDSRKGIDFLIRTMTLIKTKDPQITLHVVGTGKDKDMLEKISKRQKLSVIFYDHISDEQLDELYKKTNVQVVPSVFEGFGISILEGMAKGIPIIATNVDGIKSIINHHHSGMLVPYGDEKMLATTIIHVLEDRTLQKSLVKNAYKELSHYNWNSIYKTTVKAYEKMVS
jgi:glycosyltransferase involved in cell wall biosynthesis